LARRINPELVYASDPIGALPGLLAARFSGARLVYHEHDSPTTENDLHPFVRWARRLATGVAKLVIFPNAERGRLARLSLGFAENKLRIVWNVPRRAEMPQIPAKTESPFVLYFHGSITPDRLPPTVMEAVSNLNGAVRLDIAGYEAPGAKGYIRQLADRWNADGIERVRYLGEIPYHALLRQAACSHAGLALMPMATKDVNMRHMTGASNKPFDYMAAGLPLIVSDLPEWRKLFVDTGFGLACDPRSAQSLQAALESFLADRAKLDLIQRRCRTMIEEEWNYEIQFDQVMSALG
jgi:glycosyltransferase involved in cell wall biosynthesis